MDNKYSPLLSGSSLLDFYDDLFHFLVNAPSMVYDVFSNKPPFSTIVINGEIRQVFRKGSIKKFHFSSSTFIACILWEGEFYITGHDISKLILLFLDSEIDISELTKRKLHESVWSALRNLTDTRLEKSKSELLEWLDFHKCIKTVKSQKLFKWSSVDYYELVKVVKNKIMRLKRDSFFISNQTRNFELEPVSTFDNDQDCYLQIGNYNEIKKREKGHYLQTIKKDLEMGNEEENDLESNKESSSRFHSSFNSCLPESACNKDISFQSNENFHQFKCEYFNCKKAFRRMEHLKRHQLGHTGEKPFICTTCKKQFSRNDNLSQHLKVHSSKNMKIVKHSSLTLNKEKSIISL